MATSIIEIADKLYKDMEASFREQFGANFAAGEVIDATIDGIGEHYNIRLSARITSSGVTFYQ